MKPSQPQRSAGLCDCCHCCFNGPPEVVARDCGCCSQGRGLTHCRVEWIQGLVGGGDPAACSGLGVVQVPEGFARVPVDGTGHGRGAGGLGEPGRRDGTGGRLLLPPLRPRLPLEAGCAT